MFYFPTTTEAFLSPFSSGNEEKIIFHEYCPTCCVKYQDEEIQCRWCKGWRYQGGKEEQSKKKLKDFFLELPIQKDIEELFQDPTFLQGIRYRDIRRPEKGVWKDIHDGDEYQTLRKSGFLNNPYNLVIGFNTDGVSPFKSSSLEMWPIFWHTHDLPPT